MFAAAVSIAPDATVPARVTFAPLNVAAVVEPDFIIKLPELLVKAAYCVPASFSKMSAPSPSKTISAAESIVISPEVLEIVPAAAK